MPTKEYLPRRDLLKGGLAVGGIAAAAGMPFWSKLALAQDEVLVPFTDVPEGFTAPPVTPGGFHFLDTRYIETFYTDVDDFYIVQHYNQPTIPEESYRLRITGMVDRPTEIDLAELKSLDKVEIDAGFECGGNNNGLFHGLIGNARWGESACGTCCVRPEVRRAGSRSFSTAPTRARKTYATSMPSRALDAACMSRMRCARKSWWLTR